MQIQPLDPLSSPHRGAVQITRTSLARSRPVPDDWCYQCAARSCSRHDRAPRPSTLVRTAERIADRTLMDAEMPEPGEWDPGHVALVRAIIDELALLADVAEQVTHP